jgi:hypothetical protein
VAATVAQAVVVHLVVVQVALATLLQLLHHKEVMGALVVLAPVALRIKVQVVVVVGLLLLELLAVLMLEEMVAMELHQVLLAQA